MYDPSKPYKHQVLSLIESTWNTPHVSVARELYPTVRRKFNLDEVHHTDGIGTKGFYHWKQKTFKEAVVDALAMNLNDLAMVGAVPYALQNHIVIPKDDHLAILEIVKTIAKECKKRNIAMTGGETSIHSDIESMDISMTVLGFIPKKRKNKCKVGDVLIGIKSNGLHSNGFTAVRRKFGNSNRKDFTAPTKIYSEDILSVIKHHQVNGMMHITGGAYTKLKDILGRANAKIEQPKKLLSQEVFNDLFKKGFSNKEMYTTFNCGVGFILSIPEAEVDRILKRIKGTAVIGKVNKGEGNVRITSAFNGREITL